MPKPSRERDPIRKGASSEEYRLLGGIKRQDPHGVPIIPGQTANAKKKSINTGSFRPYDSISKGSRSSGPVPTRGKEKEKYFSSPSRPKHSTNTPERSSKRRRVESPEETPRRRATLGEEAPDRSPDRRSPSVIRLDARSPTPSQLSGQVKQPRDTNGGKASVHRASDKDVRNPHYSPKKITNHHHRFSSDDDDLSFTRDAAKERQKGPAITTEDFEFVSRKLPEQTPNLSVEIVKRPSIFDNRATKSPPPRRTGKARASYSRESPDELQGDVTVRPVPTSLSNPRRDPPNANTSSDIRPTVFISNEKPKRGHKSKREKSSKKRPPKSQRFKILYYRGTPWLLDDLGTETDQLVVDPASGEITIKIANSGIIRSISLKTVLKVFVGDTSSRKVRFELSKVEGQDTKIDLELSSSEEKEGLCSLLEKLKVDVQEKEEGYIDRIFKKSERDHKRFAGATNGHKRPLGLVEDTEEAHNPPSATTKRMRLSDALKDKDENSDAQMSSKTAPEKLNSPPPTTHDEVPNPNRASNPLSGPQHSIGVEIPVKKFNQNLQTPTRSTRAMARQAPTTLVCDDDDGPGHEYTLELDHDVDKKMTKKPLVYPRFGKKKAEVNALDLERLAPHEFLNDNIIGFYIRFLEDHLHRCNAEVAKRVYFFNSYFFARLTNSPKGRRSINYEGVEKWTRSVDLFSYDYIIIPINEDAHWYLAIICNLPYLEGIMDESKISASQRLGDTQEIPETPEPPLYGQEGVQHDTKEETTRQSLASMDISDKQGVHEEGSKRGQENWPEYEENPDLAPAKFSDFSSQPQPDSQKSAGSPKKSRKPKKRAPTGMKYDACQPIVITFDSLNQSRSSTISNLREYLSAEAKSKRGIEINKTLIKGMTAKEIPQQPNFSDCGLYLLAYLEKFVQNPDIFTRRLLRKEMRSIEDWPPLQSGLLRTRLRKFMELLYNEQEQLTKAEADRDMLMVDQQPISYLLGTPATDVTKEKVKNEKRNSPDVQVERSPSPSAKTTKPDRRREPSSISPKSPDPDIEHGQNAANTETQESVVLIDHKPRSHSTSPRRDAQDQPAKRAVVEVPDSQDQASARPTDAAKIIEPRPLQRQRKRADTVYVDDDGVVEDSAPRRKETGAQRAESTGVEIQVRGTPPPNAK